MGVYTRPDSPYYWLALPRPGRRPHRENTKIPIAGRTRAQTKQLRQDAEDAFRARAADLARRRYELPVTEPSPRAITFAAFADWYRVHVAPTKRGRERELEVVDRLVAHFGARPLASVDAIAAREYMSRRLAGEPGGRPLAPATVNRELDVLKAILVAAVPAHLPTSPLAGLKRLRTPKTEPRILTAREEDRLLQVLPAADKALMIAGLDTLMRLGDLLELRHEQDHGAYLTVVDPKNDRPYKVPISKRLREALDELEVDGPYLFHHRRHAKTDRDRRAGVRRMLERAAAAAKIPFGRPDGITFHSATRHTGASRMVEAGHSLRVVQRVGGWSDLRLLERYTHPTDRAARRAVEAVGRRPKLRRVK